VHGFRKRKLARKLEAKTEAAKLLREAKIELRKQVGPLFLSLALSRSSFAGLSSANFPARFHPRPET
jgi:hypothetical protein